MGGRALLDVPSRKQTLVRPSGPLSFPCQSPNCPSAAREFDDSTRGRNPQLQWPHVWSLSPEDGRWPAGRPPLLPSKLWGTGEGPRREKSCSKTAAKSRSASYAGPESLVSPHIDGKGVLHSAASDWHMNIHMGSNNSTELMKFCRHLRCCQLSGVAATTPLHIHTPCVQGTLSCSHQVCCLAMDGTRFITVSLRHGRLCD